MIIKEFKICSYLSDFDSWWHNEFFSSFAQFYEGTSYQIALTMKDHAATGTFLYIKHKIQHSNKNKLNINLEKACDMK
jgi:hypothetical protein